MDNPEKIATLCAQDTGRRKTKQKTQHNTEQQQNVGHHSMQK